MNFCCAGGLDGSGVWGSRIVGLGGAASPEVSGRAIVSRPLSPFLSRVAAFGLLLVAAVAASGQGQQVVPDCIIPFSFTATGQRSQLTGCGRNVNGLVDWRAVYINNGFGALTLNVQSAPDSAGVPGAWVNFVGTTVFGVNPMTAITYNSVEVNGFNPWVSVTLSAAAGAGQITGTVYGCRQPGCATGTLTSAGTAPCPGTAVIPCVVDGPDAAGAAPTQNPVQVSGFDGVNVRRISTNGAGAVNVVTAVSPCVGTAGTPCVVDGPDAPGAAPTQNPVQVSGFDGTNIQRFLICPSAIIVDDSTMGNVQIIAASGATRVRICKMTFTTAAGVGIQLTQGTGANCGVGTANLSGLYQNASSVAEDFQADQSLLVTAASQAVCLNLGANTRTTGQVNYAQF